MKRHRPALIHAHFLTDGARLVAFSRRHQLPLIVTAHGYDATLDFRSQVRSGDFRFLIALKPLLINTVATIVCVSDFIRDVLMESGFPADKLTRIATGVQPAAFGLPDLSTPREGVLFAGRLVEKKGLEHLLSAWALLPERSRQAALTIVGEGPLRADMEALAGRLGLQAQFVGAQSRANVLELMRRARVFAFPSLRARNGDAEGMGVVAMEAQALGTPVIAFDDGPGREVIADGRSGILVPRGDHAALAKALERLLSNRELAQSLGAGGPVLVRERFDLARNLATLEDLYDDITRRARVTGQSPPPAGRSGMNLMSMVGN